MKYSIFSFLFVAMVFLSGCTTYKTCSSTLTNEFTKSMMKDHPKIESLKIHCSTSEIEFTFKINTKMDEKEVIEIEEGSDTINSQAQNEDFYNIHKIAILGIPNKPNKSLNIRLVEV